MAAMLAWLLIERILHGKATSLGAASGIVAGLVAITPVLRRGRTPWVRIAIGAIAGGACAYAVGLKFKFNLDDSLDVVGVHLVGGVVGTVLIGLFSTSVGAGRHRRALLRRRAQLPGRPGAVPLGSRSSGPALFTTIIGFAIKYTIGWRIDEEDEVEGIDFSEHGETAYDFVSLSGSATGTPSALAQSNAESRGVNA